MPLLDSNHGRRSNTGGTDKDPANSVVDILEVDNVARVGKHDGRKAALGRGRKRSVAAAVGNKRDIQALPWRAVGERESFTVGAGGFGHIARRNRDNQFIRIDRHRRAKALIGKRCPGLKFQRAAASDNKLVTALLAVSLRHIGRIDHLFSPFGLKLGARAYKSLVMTEDEKIERKRAADRAYAASHREEAKARAKAWYYANKDRAAESRKANYDPDAAKEYNQAYREENGDRLREYDRKRNATPERKAAHKEWRAKNSDKVVARVAQWVKDNPEKAKASRKNTQGRRRARLLNQPHESVDANEVYDFHDGICGLCGSPVTRDEFELDHIVPIARGGGHVFTNLHPAHPTCNRKKSAKTNSTLFSI